MQKYSSLIVILGGILLFSILWPLIKWIAIIVLAAAALFVGYVYLKSRVLKQEIQQDPMAYFTKQRASQQVKDKVSSNAIDVEYKEKSVKEVSND
ncbi:MAG: hypothetical protein IJI05_03315 [Erysipelotrichaceae bacterium]|nr:hypothetical protein [Erysipelotrichaceae bacterium]